MVKKKILIVDDDTKTLRFVRANLIAYGYDVDVADSGSLALQMTERILPDLIILDINLPDIGGIEVCKAIRSWLDVPIIMLTVLCEETDKVKALRQGADDYLVKPFGMEELIARIEANLRRYIRSEISSPLFYSGDLKIDLSRRLVKKSGKTVKLSPTEYKILECLVINCGKVVAHSELLSKVWGPDYLNEIEYLRVYIGHLRHKIEDNPSEPAYIVTELNMGYRFIKPDPTCILPSP